MKSIANFFTTEFGQPSFGINSENAEGSFKIQLWVYLPPSGYSSDNIVIQTVGLAQRSFNGPCPWIELSFQIPGQHERPQLEKLGMLLGELIYDTLKVTEFTPNLLLTHLKRQYMPEMQDIMVTEGAGLRPLWVEMEDRTIRMLSLIPLYRDEVSIIRKMGFWNSYRDFIYQKINFVEVARPRLRQAMFHPDELRGAREVAIYNAPISKAEIWEDIRRWYQLNAPNIKAAQLKEQPAYSANWADIFGLSSSLDSRNHSSQSDEWIVQHWKRLYAGGFLPTQDKVLHLNPHFIT